MKTLVMKINPEHFPTGTFATKEHADWEGSDFIVPRPKTMDGKSIAASEIAMGLPVWIWEHVKAKNEIPRPRGLVAIARTEAAHEAQGNKVSLRLSDVQFLPIPILRDRMAKLESEVVQSFIKATTRRVAMLNGDEAAEFGTAVADFINKQMLQIGKPAWAEPLLVKQANSVPSLWSDDELTACLLSYLEMLAKEQVGVTYSKSEYRAALKAGPLSTRSDGSIEFRMQDISAFFAGKGLPRIEGYKPAKNVGSSVLERLEIIFLGLQLGNSESFQQTADFDVLYSRAFNLQKTGTRLYPVGNRNPQRKVGETNSFVRDPAIVAEVLNLANGVCECCQLPGPFRNPEGQVYLEVHHVKFLANGGPDTMCNAVGVCPNCHRALHYSLESAELRLKLLKSVIRLKSY